jgi:hypothetical protein
VITRLRERIFMGLITLYVVPHRCTRPLSGVHRLTFIVRGSSE